MYRSLPRSTRILDALSALINYQYALRQSSRNIVIRVTHPNGLQIHTKEVTRLNRTFRCIECEIDEWEHVEQQLIGIIRTLTRDAWLKKQICPQRASRIGPDCGSDPILCKDSR